MENFSGWSGCEEADMLRRILNRGDEIVKNWLLCLSRWWRELVRENEVREKVGTSKPYDCLCNEQMQYDRWVSTVPPSFLAEVQSGRFC
jgi:hypothetical protein